MRTQAQHSNLLQGMAWTGGILGVLLTLFLLVDVGLKLAEPLLSMEVLARVDDQDRSVNPLEIAVAQCSSPSVPKAPVVDGIRLALETRALAASLVTLGIRRHSLLVPAIAGVLVFGGSVCRAANDTV